MIRRKKEHLEWLEFELLQPFPEVAHGIFLRHGGVSQKPFDSLNVGEGLGDDPKAVAQNLLRIADHFQVPTLISAKQKHGDSIKVVHSKTDLQCDGLITNRYDTALLIRHADCQVGIFFDPVQKVIANIHSGWRGSVSNIFGKTVKKLQKEFGSLPKHLRVCISPSLGPENAEYKEGMSQDFSAFQVKPNYFDFWAISKMQLQQMGVLEEHIEIAKICTFCEKKDFFSHRRDKKTGRHGTIVVLKSS